MPPAVVHTVLLFLPGNTGLVGWYVPMLGEIVRRLGPWDTWCRGFVWCVPMCSSKDRLVFALHALSPDGFVPSQAMVAVDSGKPSPNHHFLWQTSVVPPFSATFPKALCCKYPFRTDETLPSLCCTHTHPPFPD